MRRGHSSTAAGEGDGDVEGTKFNIYLLLTLRSEDSNFGTDSAVELTVLCPVGLDGKLKRCKERSKSFSSRARLPRLQSR